MIETADTAPTLEESYAVAKATSDLTVTIHRKTAVDYVIAAGASHTLLSAALTSLRTEWDRTPKVPKMTEAQVQELADSYRPKPEPRKALKRARAEALLWHERQIREQAKRLRSLSAVMEQLLPWVMAKNIAPEAEVHGLTWLAVYHWINPNCPVCDGKGGLPEEGTPVLKHVCHYCGGTKIWPEPLGSYRIKAYIKDSVHNAHREMRGKLR